MNQLDEEELLESEEELGPSDEYVPLPGAIQVGDYVQLKGQGAVGEVLAIQGKDASVAMGSLKSLIKLKRLTRISRKEKRKLEGVTGTRPVGQGINMIDKRSNFSSNLDIRGMRGEESLSVIEAFVDDATMLGSNEVRIIHGKGNGVLRQVVREQLRKYPVIKDARDEHIERGGAGVTLVKLN